MEKYNNWLASENDRKVFFDALLNPPAPNHKLKDAMKKTCRIQEEEINAVHLLQIIARPPGLSTHNTKPWKGRDKSGHAGLFFERCDSSCASERPLLRAFSAW